MYEIYGLRLGEKHDIESGIILAHTDPGKPISINYYMWCIRSADAVILVDTGMSEVEVKKRNLFNEASPASQLSKIGVNPKEVTKIVVTHLHADHISAFDLYPNATFYIQKKEMEFYAAVNTQNKALVFGAGDIVGIIRLNYAGRVKPVDGEEEIAPGLSLVWVGAHTPGSQVVAVETSEGTAILCGDVVCLYRNIEEGIPGGLAFDIVESFSAIERIRRLASTPRLIIPGHDPLVMERFPKIADGIIRIGRLKADS